MAEVGAARRRRCCRRCRRAGLPLDAELGRLVGVHLDDQALDVDLRAARCRAGRSPRADLPVLRLGRRDDQRVGRRVGLDLAAGEGWADGCAAASSPGWRRAGGAAAVAAAAAARRSALPGRRRCRGRRGSRRDRRAQRRGQLGGVGVLQVDDIDVAAGAAARRAGRACRPASAPGSARAGLAARTMSELLRGSAITVVRNDASAWPGGRRRRPAPLDPRSRCTMRRDVGRQRVLQRDHLDVGRVGDVERGDDARRCAAGCRRSR